MNKWRKNRLFVKNLLLTATLSFTSVYAQDFIKGVDLSYVNQMEDCGATYYESNAIKDPYQIMADHGANLVRLRLWHTPDWQTASPVTDINTYSTLNDVKISINRARTLGMQVLLDFHYSDTWADPGAQTIPAAWEHLLDDTSALAVAVYDYTYSTLIALDDENLMPEYVQVGNEINREILLPEGSTGFPIDWTRNSTLLNAGIAAVRDAGAATDSSPQIILHAADPANGMWWFEAVTESGVTDFDIIGLSYYTQWHAGSITQTGATIANLKNMFDKEVLIVETGAIWTTASNDSANNVMNTFPAGYTGTGSQIQRDWLIDLANEVFTRGGIGVVYWEPAWVSTDCYTRWGRGSHWENATFFDFNNHLIENGGVTFLQQDYPVANDDSPAPPTAPAAPSSGGGACNPSFIFLLFFFLLRRLVKTARLWRAF